MTKVYWAKSGANLTITGGTCNAHLVAEAGSNITVSCHTLNGESWMSGNLTLGCSYVNRNINGGTPN
jgi:hypothetical protein